MVPPLFVLPPQGQFGYSVSFMFYTNFRAICSVSVMPLYFDMDCIESVDCFSFSVTQLCPTLCNPMDLACQAFLSMEFSRQDRLFWVVWTFFFFGCAGSQLQHTRSSVFVAAFRILVVACDLLVAACGIQFPVQGSNPGTLHWEHEVLATGPPKKSWYGHFLYNLIYVIYFWLCRVFVASWAFLQLQQAEAALKLQWLLLWSMNSGAHRLQYLQHMGSIWTF